MEQTPSCPSSLKINSMSFWRCPPRLCAISSKGWLPSGHRFISISPQKLLLCCPDKEMAAEGFYSDHWTLHGDCYLPVLNRLKPHVKNTKSGRLLCSLRGQSTHIIPAMLGTTGLISLSAGTLYCNRLWRTSCSFPLCLHMVGITAAELSNSFQTCSLWKYQSCTPTLHASPGALILAEEQKEAAVVDGFWDSLALPR